MLKYKEILTGIEEDPSANRKTTKTEKDHRLAKGRSRGEDFKLGARQSKCKAIARRLTVIAEFISSAITEPSNFKLWLNGSGEEFKVAIEDLNYQLKAVLQRCSTRHKKDYEKIFRNAITGVEKDGSFQPGIVDYNSTLLIDLLLHRPSLRKFFNEDCLQLLEHAEEAMHKSMDESGINPAKIKHLNFATKEAMSYFYNSIPDILPPPLDKPLMLNQDQKISGKAPKAVTAAELEALNDEIKKSKHTRAKVSVSKARVTLFYAEGEVIIKHKSYTKALTKHNPGGYENAIHPRINEKKVSTQDIIDNLSSRERLGKK